MAIFVGTPSYDRRLHHGYVHALLGTADALRDRSIATATSRVFCQRMVHRAEGRHHLSIGRARPFFRT